MVKDDWQGVARLRALLASQIGQQRYEVWFGPQTELVLDGQCLTVRVPNAFVRDWLRQHFRRELVDCCQQVLGWQPQIEFDVDGTLLLRCRNSTQTVGETSNSENIDVAADAPPANGSRAERRAGKSPKLTIKSCDESPAKAPSEADHPANQPPRHSPAWERMTLERFVIGKSNDFAATSARLIAGASHQASPVFFWGPNGVGKTHLLRGIVHASRRRGRQARATYLTAEQFTTSFVAALRGGGMPSFRQKCRGAELLVLDDVQFLDRKRATIEELLYTVDALSTSGRQVVLSSDRPLADLGFLGAEFASRIVGGLTCEIGPPDFATRLEIVRGQSAALGLSLTDDLLAVIAARITAGAREMQGALNRIQMISQVKGQPVSRELVDECLAEVAHQLTRPVGLPDIQKAVCDVFGLDATQLRSDRKSRAVAEPRMLAMWLSRERTRAPWSEIGQFYGRRSHSTVIAAHHRIEAWVRDGTTIDLADRTCGIEEAIRKVESALRSA